jgi:hypothetical protein
MLPFKHRPIFDTDKIVKHYTDKDGVDIKYVCTSAVSEYAAFAADVFYRDTPHPQFGNRYFALYHNYFADKATIMITNADRIETFDFCCIEYDGHYHYSQHRHDYLAFPNKTMIDGGRAYVRSGGHTTYFKIKDGQFVGEEK